ncbi:MAG: XRE family transcriptional regulator [Bdellovibrionales bacterium]
MSKRSKTPTKILKSEPTSRRRYKNTGFLLQLGEHCRRLRLQKGYSIDRLAKESDQLSTASIDRLERGLADTQILVLVRYAEALGVSLLDLFSFIQSNKKDPRLISFEEGMRPPLGYVPVYPLSVAAGVFSHNRETLDLEPLGWVESGIRTTSSDYFATYIQGHSMEPLIPDGALVLFKRYGGGSRQGKILLVQARGLRDSETGQSYVVKRYQRKTPPRSHSQAEVAEIHLVSENPAFEKIVLKGLTDDDVQTLAEFMRVL